MIKLIFQFIIGYLALYLIVKYSSWNVAIGIILLMWANNLDYVREK
jgi:hypothetical protein